MAGWNEKTKPSFKTEQQIIKEILEGVEGERAEKNCSYLELVSKEFSEVIFNLALENWPHYYGEFDNFIDFQDDLAKNWLVKNRAFEKIARAAGMRYLSREESQQGLVNPNKYLFAMLSANASYLLVGPLELLTDRDQGRPLNIADYLFAKEKQ